MKSRTFEDDGPAGPSRRSAAPAAATTSYGVELRPVEFRYTVVDGAADGAGSSTTHGGVALASRASPAAEVLGDILRVSRTRTVEMRFTLARPELEETTDPTAVRTSSVRDPPLFSLSLFPPVFFFTRPVPKAAAPSSDGECARLWRRGPAYDERGHTSPSSRTSATADPGDGYEVLDVDCLFPAPPLRPAGTPSRPPRAWGGPASRRPASRAAGPGGSPPRTPRREPPTVGRWLGLSPCPGDGGDAAVVVDLIVETRPSPAAAWSRSSLQLDSRIRVGDYVDAQDSARKWYEAVVREVGEDTVKVHFVGWGSKWDTTLPRRRRGDGSDVSSCISCGGVAMPCPPSSMPFLFSSPCSSLLPHAPHFRCLDLIRSNSICPRRPRSGHGRPSGASA